MNSNRNLLCMKWDEFDHFIVGGIFDLYQKDEMADVTLFCEGRSFKAHRVLLCMWSSYFKEVFSATSHPHPVIILRETTSVDLELILRFIYQGQLFVPYEDADRFLKTAEYFQIAGLRNMRIHTTEDTSPTFPSNSNFVTNNNNSSKSQNHSLNDNISQPPQSFSLTGTPFASAVNSNNLPGIPVRIISNSSSSSSVSHQHSNISSASIISDNVSQTQFSSNVIRSNGRSNLTHQRPQMPLRSISPVQSTSTHSYHHGGNKCEEDIVYQTQPVLIVHNPQKVNEYHSQRTRGPPEHRRPSDSVVILENAGSNSQMQMTMLNQEPVGLSQTVSSSGTYALYNQSQPVIAVDTSGQEEVLGLEYLHENSRSSHSQIIQEAAAAAGVEDAEIMETNRETSFPSPGVSNSGSRVLKQNSVVLTTTTTPVYAVKRVPPTPIVQQSTSSETIKIIPKPTKSKPKRRKHTTVQLGGTLNSDNDTTSKKVEFVSCPKCSKRVKKTSLNVHMKRTHLEEGTVLACPICGKQISSKGVYYKHMYLHRQKSEFKSSGDGKVDK